MKNDYLWDGSGEPDPELQHFERSLGQFRYSGEAPNFPAIISVRHKPSLFSFLTMEYRLRSIAIALLSLVLIASGLLLRISPSTVRNAPEWNVARLEGAPRVGPFSLASDSRRTQLRVGQTLVTDNASRATLSVAEIGELYVDPDSRVRLIETGSDRERLALELGTIHAAIWAPPGKFVVDTPSATAVDLGCAYTLHVNADGSGTLRTTLGWVGFHKNDHDSFIPAGAMCLTRPAKGPGTPYFEDASEKLRNALHSFDSESASSGARQQYLRTIVREARSRDAFTLWHLLFQVSDEERPLVYDRMAALVPLPAGVTREGSLALNPQMLDTWWNRFDLGDIAIWRFWEQNQVPHVVKKAR